MDMPTLNLIKNPSTYKLVIPAEVEKKIRYLCQKIPNVEWSGTLFYTYEGSMKENNLVIICQDIFVMDIGTSAYTEFDMSPDVISYMTDHPELLDMQIGLIHSHNHMATFFSGTDINTLKEEGKDRNHFVSLIVNNEGNYTAAITRKVKYIKTIQEKYEYGSYNDTVVNDKREYTEEEECIEYFMLNITKEGNVSFEEIDKRLKEIKKEKEVLKVSKIPTIPDFNPDFNSEFKPHLFYNSPNDCMDIKEDVVLPPYDISKEDIQHVLLQLLTGSIIIRNPSKIDIEKWVHSMPQIYEKRFGKGKEGFNKFTSWADTYCEFLILDKEPAGIETGREETDWISFFAMDLNVALEELPNNEYMDILKDIVSQWIV